MNIKELVRKNIIRLESYSSARDEFVDFDTGRIFLDANENPFENGVNRYPDPYQKKLKGVISKIKNIPTENILLGNGSDEVLDLIFRVFCEPKEDNIIILPPTYGMYKVLANINDIAIKKVFLKTDFNIDTKAILKEKDLNTKIIFLCSPNNPTGNSFNVKQVETLLMKFNGIVVLDEAYIDFSEKKSVLEKLYKYPNLIIIQTLSKACGMAGIRLGICFASREIISFLNKIKPPYNVNNLSQQKAIARLENYSEILNEITQLNREKKYLVQSLSRINFIEKVFPSDANFLLIKVDNAVKRYSELISRGIVIRNRTHEPLCTNCLRVSVGISEENAKLIRTLEEIEQL